MFQILDARMRRAVQQENRSIQASLSATNNKKKKLSSSLLTSSSSRKRFCPMILVVLSPIVVIFLVMIVLQTCHRTTVQEDDLKSLDKSAGQVVSQQILLHQLEQHNSKKKKKKNIRKPSKKSIDIHHDISAVHADTKSLSVSQTHRTKRDALVLTTEYGKIRIVLMPELSPESVEYIYKLVESGVCKRCNFYRSEKPGILQGVMANPNIPVNEKRGPCPEGLEGTVPNECPDWDKNCGCHGPVMTKGAVGWAGGDAGGPDFFIDHYTEPAKFWGTQHTNFGKIQDDESFAVIGRIFDQPVEEEGMMLMLETPIHFDLSIEPVVDGGGSAGIATE
ncbi:cyclophilin type peptidyl-prolyl cis-trans isomerase [Nitzschia inconspicua]|uniref:Cyclophilin type peptidyl-prolyl cis-trans isomerase n=1 Tax=Nitzschia inconspicua TaxID=303405 RepID=A0A9K3L3F2_9STRA|nr:cyclophilin type peptidyl-prolyl cis-trans isomerase [Nitzschia inconspicua]